MKITQIHNLLSKKEFKKFGDFIKSPYFNSEPRFIKVYELIKSEGSNFNRNIIAEKIFGNKSSTGELRFRKLVSEFMELFKRYISQTEYDASELIKRKMQLQWLRKIKDQDNYLKFALETDCYIKQNYVKDEEFYLELTVLFAKLYEYNDTGIDASENNFSFLINDYLDKYFVSMKLFLYQRMNSLEYSANLDPSQLKTFEKSVFEYIEIHKEALKSKHPEIYLRHIGILLDKNGFNRELYEEYLVVLRETQNRMLINEHGLLLTLLNIISKFINSGRNDLSDKVFEIAELLFEKNILLNKGIDYVDLKIIIETAIGNGKYDWALSYMNKVKMYIKYDFPENVYNMLTSKIYFFKNDYNKARKLLSEISIDDYIFYCEAKLIECRIAYHENDLESVLSSIDTVKKYLRSHKNIGKHYISSYEVFSNMLKKLTLIKMSSFEKILPDYEILSFLKELNNLTSPCYAHKWLIEQLEKFKAG